MERERFGGGGEEQSPGLISQGQWAKRKEEQGSRDWSRCNLPPGHSPEVTGLSPKHPSYSYSFIYLLWRGLDKFRAESSLDYVYSWLEPLMTSFESEVAQS